MPNIITLNTDPKIRITVEFEDSQVKKTCLSLSESFECEWVGNGDERVKEELLAFLKSYTLCKTMILPLPLQKLTPFRSNVLTTLQTVPFGSVVSYGELAELSGHPRAARAVGSACHHNPFPLFIPCHRVIASGRKMGGFAFNLRIKKRLLDFEAGY